MIDRGLQGLAPSTLSMAERVNDRCNARGFDILIYCGLRTCREQAILYRQSRPFSVIRNKMQQLRMRGYDFLADMIDLVGPQSGPHVTNAAPGQSWHNYGLAFDAVPVVDGALDWSVAGKYQDTGLQREWAIYGEECERAGLYWAGRWKTFREYPHAQSVAAGNALETMTPSKAHDALVRAGAL